MIVIPAPKFPKPQYRRPTRPVKKLRARAAPAAPIESGPAEPDGVLAGGSIIDFKTTGDVVRDVENILTGSATPACDLLVLVDDGYLTATEATQALQGTGRNIADVHSAAAFEKDEALRRQHMENSIESPEGGLLQNLPHDDDYDPADEDDARDHDDTPSLQNCDDWGTGEGRYHGRM